MLMSKVFKAMSLCLFRFQGLFVIIMHSEVDGYKPRPTAVRMLLPHEVLHCLAEYPFAFSSLLLGNTTPDARRKFWDHIRKLDPWSKHPIFEKDENDRVSFDSLIPLTIHGDGAQMFREQDVFVFSMSSLFGSTGILEDVLLFKFPFCMIPEMHMRSDRVFQF